MILKRAQIGKGKGIDISVRQKIPFVSPDWQHVMDYKKNIIGDEKYTEWYLLRLESGKEHIHNWVKELGNPDEITFLCYCPDNTFCHTYLLIDWLIKNWPEEFKKAA